MAYPDYGKAPTEYIASLISVIATYDENVQQCMANLRTGIASKCKFLPTVADIVEFGDAREKLNQPQKKPFKPFLIEKQQDPAERARVGVKMKALLAELQAVKILEPIASRVTDNWKPKMSRAEMAADLAAIKARVTPERLNKILNEMGLPSTPDVEEEPSS